MLTGLGPISIRVPRVKDRSAQGVRFESRLVPHYMRQVRAGDAALRGFCLHRLAQGNLAPVLEALVGTCNLPSNVITRLKLTWNQMYAGWDTKDLSKERWACIWADAISYSGESDEDEHCMLVAIGINDCYQKRLLAIRDKTQPSAEAWHSMLIALKRRGLAVTEAVAGHDATGFMEAFEPVFANSR